MRITQRNRWIFLRRGIRRAWSSRNICQVLAATLFKSPPSSIGATHASLLLFLPSSQPVVECRQQVQFLSRAIGTAREPGSSWGPIGVKATGCGAPIAAWTQAKGLGEVGEFFLGVVRATMSDVSLCWLQTAESGAHAVECTSVSRGSKQTG